MAVEHLLQLRSQHAERLPRLARVPPQRLAILPALAGAEADTAVKRHGGCSCFKRLVKLSQGSNLTMPALLGRPCAHPTHPAAQARHLAVLHIS